MKKMISGFCRACGKRISNKENCLWCDKCKKEIGDDFRGEGLRHGFDYYFRWFLKHKC